MAIGREMPEPEFRKLVDRSEALAALPAPDYPPGEFDLLVVEAIDNLPPEFQALLEDTPVVISNLGHEHRAYGMYMGGTVARDIYPDRIVIRGVGTEEQERAGLEVQAVEIDRFDRDARDRADRRDEPHRLLDGQRHERGIGAQ